MTPYSITVDGKCSRKALYLIAAELSCCNVAPAKAYHFTEITDFNSAGHYSVG